nr:RNA-directed DNA polymerase, eukaryota, nucleotide-binding alpha-beta plait domain protein [Tanacetum cinerariifolium]
MACVAGVYSDSQQAEKYDGRSLLWRAGTFAKKEARVNFLTDPSDGRSTLRPVDVLGFGWLGGKHAPTFNFTLDDCFSKDLWKVCNGYGTVVDVFIPSKRSKAGKRFAFVRFIKVLDLDRLIENLNTIWIGRFHLFANPVRYERPKGASLHKGVSRSSNSALLGKQPKVQDKGGSYVNVVKGNNLPPVIITYPALVLEESCIVSRNLDFFVLGETKNPSYISW